MTSTPLLLLTLNSRIFFLVLYVWYWASSYQPYKTWNGQIMRPLFPLIGLWSSRCVGNLGNVGFENKTLFSHFKIWSKSECKELLTGQITNLQWGGGSAIKSIQFNLATYTHASPSSVIVFFFLWKLKKKIFVTLSFNINALAAILSKC